MYIYQRFAMEVAFLEIYQEHLTRVDSTKRWYIINISAINEEQTSFFISMKTKYIFKMKIW